jgi:hypothetical protein
MAVGFRAAGAWQDGATGLVADEVAEIPAAQLTTDMVVVIACWKDFAITAQVSGYTELFELADGTTGTGNGTGSMKVGIWYKIAASDAESNPTVDFSTTTGLLGEVTVIVFTSGGGTWATPTFVVGAINTWGTGGGTTSASSTITIPDGSAILGVAAIRDDSATFTRGNTAIDDAGGLVTWNGNYAEQPATHASTTTGNDMACDAGYRLVTTGAAGVTLRQTGTLSATETGQAAWIVLAIINPVTGTGAGTQPAAGASGAGKETFRATGAGSGTASTSSGAAKLTFASTGAGTGTASTSEGAGKLTFASGGAGTQATATAQGTGSVEESTTGTGAGTQATATGAGSGLLTFSSSGAGTQAAATSSGAGTELFAATGTGTQETATGAGSGTLTFTGTGSATQPASTASGSGVNGQGFVGTGASEQPASGAVGMGTVTDPSFSASGAGTQAAAGAFGSLVLTFTGTGGGTGAAPSGSGRNTDPTLPSVINATVSETGFDTGGVQASPRGLGATVTRIGGITARVED